MGSSPFRKRVADLGDCALIVTGRTESKAITLKENDVYQTRFGALRHNDCRNKLYGSQISTSCGYIQMLSFDPVLWSRSLPHRTQIIYPSDASLVVGGLDLIPGKRVMEAGTGSGSLTHFLCQAVWPTGRVLSFEFHAERAKQAKDEFHAHKLSGLVTVFHRDICSEGFPPLGHPDNLDGVDAISLDLPQPWLVIPSLPNVFRSTCGGRVCSFSPCIEQVQRTTSALRKAGFVHIQTVECLERGYDVVQAVLNVPNLGQVGAGKSDNPDSSSKTDINKTGWWTNRFLLPSPSGSKPAKTGQKRLAVALPFEPDAKFACVEPNDRSVESEVTNGDPIVSKEKRTKSGKPTTRAEPRDGFTWEAIPQAFATGHTGYLTFASWLPIFPRKLITSQGCDEPDQNTEQEPGSYSEDA